MHSSARIVSLRVASLAVILFLWESTAGGVFSGIGFLDPAFFSRPSLIMQDIIRYWQSGLLSRDLLVTLEASFIGLALGLVSGVMFGLLLGSYRTLYAVVDPYLTAFNSLPRPALAPLLIIWLGLGLPSKIFLSWSLVFFVVCYNTIYGIRNIDGDLINSIKVMGATSRQLTRIVILPSVLVWIFAAFRTSVSFSLIGAVVGEFVGATAGLGYRSVVAAGLFDTDRVFSILFILMALGVMLVHAATLAENRVLRWRPPAPH